MKRLFTLLILFSLTMGITNAEISEIQEEQVVQPMEQHEILLTPQANQKKYELGKSKYNKDLHVNSAPIETPTAQDYSKTDPNQKRSATINRKKNRMY